MHPGLGLRVLGFLDVVAHAANPRVPAEPLCSENDERHWPQKSQDERRRGGVLLLPPGRVFFFGFVVFVESFLFPTSLRGHMSYGGS